MADGQLERLEALNLLASELETEIATGKLIFDFKNSWSSGEIRLAYIPLRDGAREYIAKAINEMTKDIQAKALELLQADVKNAKINAVERLDAINA